MADPIPSIDLRLTPDWVKESEPANRYADYEGGDQSDGRSARRERRDDRGRRGVGQDRSRRDGPEPRRPAPPRGARPDGQRPAAPSVSQERRDRPEAPRFRRDDSPAPAVEPAHVQIDFLPEERAFAKIIQQMKHGHAAYPLFGLARMFLERPERHRVRIRSLDDSKMLYQLDDHGPVATEAQMLERIAFAEKKDDFYETQVIEKEPIKGNFSSVARCTLSGRILGPTNYHAFQPAIRALYDQRFSRRMSFEEYRRTIEVTSNPEAVNQWKQEARKSTTFRTKEAENLTSLENLNAVEQHFRTHYLIQVVKPCLAAEISGETARQLPDQHIMASIRKARDRENRFPAQMAGALRHGLNQSGLHVFKHKKRILYISTVRPHPFDPTQATVSNGLGAILSTLRSYPKITRKQLAEKVFAKVLRESGHDETSAEYQRAKTSLAGDLLWLAKVGHVIEFADGTLDLPLPPKSFEKPASPDTSSPTSPSPHQAADLSPLAAAADDTDPSAAAPADLSDLASPEAESADVLDLPSEPSVGPGVSSAITPDLVLAQAERADLSDSASFAEVATGPSGIPASENLPMAIPVEEPVAAGTLLPAQSDLSDLALANSERPEEVEPAGLLHPPEPKPMLLQQQQQNIWAAVEH